MAKELKQKQLKEELKIYRKELHEKQKIREEEEAEIKKWEILNRYKQDEVIKQYDEIKKQKDKEKLVSYRKQLLEQMVGKHNQTYKTLNLKSIIFQAENEERFKKEKEEEEYVIDTTEEDDKKFFSYAEEVRELVKSKGQSTYPVDRVISVRFPKKWQNLGASKCHYIFRITKKQSASNNRFPQKNPKRPKIRNLSAPNQEGCAMIQKQIQPAAKRNSAELRREYTF